jgi:hydroxymethylpyrimidine/phosphomethylpyrimidine kinase
MAEAPPVVLTIAGFDPSSGAGVTADIKTIAAHGCYGVAAITALTVQSTAGVSRISPVGPQELRDSLEMLAGDMEISAVHIGMLGSAKLAAAVADFLEGGQHGSVVLDPVLRSTSGTCLLERAGTKVLVDRLLPLATMVTPNADEAAVLTDRTVASIQEMIDSAKALRRMGANHVLVTGGHLEKTLDILHFPDGDVQTFKSDRLNSKFTHGTGCALSTAIACHLALGRSVPEAVLLAKAYVTSAIANGYAIGKGINPLNHMYRMEQRVRPGKKQLESEAVNG